MSLTQSTPSNKPTCLTSTTSGNPSSVAENVASTIYPFSIHVDVGDNQLWSETFTQAINQGDIRNPELNGASIIIVEQKDTPTDHTQDLIGLEKAYRILMTNPEAKIVIVSILLFENKFDALEKLAGKKGKQEILTILRASPNVRFVEFPASLDVWNAISFTKRESTSELSNVDLMIAMHSLSARQLGSILHALASHKVKDPYHPENYTERNYVNEAFALAQRYFPGLDTVEKMLDYVLHVKIDIPEVMKDKRIEGVYCDVDGTLIEYVPIGSDKEGTQQLRPEVVKLLKTYEADGKQITIRTGGDVEMKTAYLRSLGITRPVVSKYDYAGATAEIVVDDTDKASFILQSKIFPETYIDTSKLDA